MTYWIGAGDVDLDGDVDLILDGKRTRYYENVGAAHFLDRTAARLPSTSASSVGGALAGIDEDGDLDIIRGKSNATNELLVNLERHVYAPHPPAVGQRYELTLFSRPGFAAASELAFPAFASRETRLRVPGLGMLFVDPASAVVLPGVALPAPQGFRTISVPLPADPSLRGVTLSVQALVGPPARMHLSNLMRGRIR